MKLFISSMPIIAIVMILNNYSHQWDTKSIVEYDTRAEAIFKEMRGRHFPDPPEKVVSVVLQEDGNF